MTKYLSLFLFACLFSTSLLASEFEGSWSGDGYIMSLEEREPTSAFFQLTVSFSEELLSLEQCVLPKSGASSQECSSATYKVVGDVVYNQFDEKIGDIFPGKIFILESNAQASEQIQLDLNNSGELRFNYSYVNLDGASIAKKAYLKKD
jgi:hypothetical protein